MKIGITGGNGFLGWHMQCYLHALGKTDQVELAGRDVFGDQERLNAFVARCDVIFHFAGVNRAADPEEVTRANPALAEQLVEALRASKSKAHVLYSSTTHADGDSGYGVSKRSAGEVLARWSEASDGRLTTMVFPHLYGECGRPFYNSAIHTFCHQLAEGESPSVTGNGQLELLHAQDAAELAWNAIIERTEGQLRPAGRKISVREAADILTKFHASYCAGVVPDLRDPEDRKLFNTLRTAMFPKSYPMKPVRREDQRGWLFEAIREQNGGQVFMSSTHPGFTRGNHYHRFKVERFCVVSGNAVIRLRRLFSNEVIEFPVSGDEPCFIDMPPLYTHSIENHADSGQDVITLFWANEFFDPDMPDTYPEPVIQ